MCTEQKTSRTSPSRGGFTIDRWTVGEENVPIKPAVGAAVSQPAALHCRQPGGPQPPHSHPSTLPHPPRKHANSSPRCPCCPLLIMKRVSGAQSNRIKAFFLHITSCQHRRLMFLQWPLAHWLSRFCHFTPGLDGKPRPPLSVLEDKFFHLRERN